MAVFVVGASHRNADPATLATLALTSDAKATLSEQLTASEHITGHVILSTCNRVELYLSAPAFHPAHDDAVRAWARTLNLYPGWINSTLYAFHDERAVAHAFTVATGLDSLAPGEPQIHSQFRQAYRRALRESHTDPALHILCNATLRVSRSVRHATSMSTVAPSLVLLGLDQAHQILGTRPQHTAILGAGNMAALVAHTLTQRQAGPGTGTVYARDPKAGRTLAARLGTSWTVTTDVRAALKGADLVISAAGGTKPLVTATTLDTIGHPPRQIYLDLGMPPNVDAGIDAHPFTRRIGLDDLAQAPNAAHKYALDRAHDLVRDHVTEHQLHAQQNAVVPAITAMRANAAAAITDELDRARAATGPLTVTDLEDALQRLTKRLLHAPTLATREALSHCNNPQDLADALNRLYAHS